MNMFLLPALMMGIARRIASRYLVGRVIQLYIARRYRHVYWLRIVRTKDS